MANISNAALVYEIALIDAAIQLNWLCSNSFHERIIPSNKGFIFCIQKFRYARAIDV